MSIKVPFVSISQIESISHTYSTPFVIYDEKSILERVSLLDKWFSSFCNFKNYFAVKATPNPTILKILKQANQVVDCSSLWELVMSERCGFSGEDIMFTSNNTKSEEFIKAHELWAIINFDDMTHIPFYMQCVWSAPRVACCRYTPSTSIHSNNIIWSPKQAKYGMREDQILDAYKLLKSLWVKSFGLHAMLASNETNPDHFGEVSKLLFDLVGKIEKEVGIEIYFVNLWWGIGIDYHPDDPITPIVDIIDSIKQNYNQIIINQLGKTHLNIFMECGRFITGPCWWLVTKVIHLSDKYKKYVWVDASMQCLMRPAMYWSYHHITVLGKEQEISRDMYDVVWSLCENNDKFAIDRKLPAIALWDYLYIHDAWAHGTAMWFNYNAQLRPSELLLKSDNSIEMIRRAESLSDYFATVDGINWFTYPQSPKFYFVRLYYIYKLITQNIFHIIYCFIIKITIF